MNIKSGRDSIYIYIYIYIFYTYISTYKHIFIQVVEAIFKIFELKYFQRAHHIINICIIIIITVIIIEFQKLKYFLDFNFSNTFQFSSNAFSPNQRLVPE